MQKSNVISFKVSEKTQEMMTEELSWCMRENTPAYAKWQAKDGDTVVTLSAYKIPDFIKEIPPSNFTFPFSIK